MPAPLVYTVQDAIESLVHTIGGGPTERLRMGIGQAVILAYQQLVDCHNWNYFYDAYRLQLSVPYSTGTIAYNSSTRVVTLTGGTWPTWALYGHIKVGDVVSRVYTRDSDTALTLDPVHTFNATIASGTAYTLYRNVYTLPSNFRAMYRPLGENTGYIGQYIRPNDWHFEERRDSTSGTPQAFTIMGDPNLIGSMAIHVWPYPDAAETYDFAYQKSGRPLRYTGNAANDFVGTVSGSAGSAAITGSSTVVTADMVGSIIRFGDTSNVPTGRSGLYPYVEQKVIAARSSATAFTVDSNLDNTYSAVKYVISDPIDLPPRMLAALLRWAEYELAAHGDKRTWSSAERRFKDALIRAKEADIVMLGPRVMGGGISGAYDSPTDTSYLDT